ncbi:hypothetical protein DV737_g4605, partial [Chaetothyriales sp. CBS 132003]
MSGDGSLHNNSVTTAEAQAPVPWPYANGALTAGGGGGGTKQSQVGEEQGQQREQQVRSLKKVCKDIHDRVYRFLHVEPPSGADGDVIRRTQRQTRISQGVIQQALLEYGTNPRHRPAAHQTANSVLPHPQPHPPSHTYLSQLDGEVGKEEETVVTFRDAFAQYLDHNANVKAIFVGTRRTDPHGHKLTFFDPTDGQWPKFMRIHPVLEWKLDEIWCFLRSRELGSLENGQWKGLEYCSMYDQGYTSLGGTGDTLRNPRLKVHEPGGSISWRPAYQMVDDERERDGRE